jgi:hypothetical protein
MKEKPYIEDGDIRTFTQYVEAFELVWHRDKEDRHILPTHTTDWQFQLDNDIPRILGKDKLFIPKETYHRLIKGTGDLSLKIWKK